MEKLHICRFTLCIISQIHLFWTMQAFVGFSRTHACIAISFARKTVDDIQTLVIVFPGTLQAATPLSAKQDINIKQAACLEWHCLYPRLPAGSLRCNTGSSHATHIGPLSCVSVRDVYLHFKRTWLICNNKHPGYPAYGNKLNTRCLHRSPRVIHDSSIFKREKCVERVDAVFV